MNASFSPESSRPAPVSQGAPQGGRQTPSVPISVYRELATELKATQAMVESLTQQNKHLSQQNQMLRQEMLNFAESADRLRQAVGYSQPQPSPSSSEVGQFGYPEQEIRENAMGLGLGSAREVSTESTTLPERLGGSVGSGVSNLASHLNRLVSPKPKHEEPNSPPEQKPGPKRPPVNKPQILYTEERLEPSKKLSKGESSTDLSGLWLATTILLIVVSAFGAGFLIMKPLLNNSR
jgi:hypothetical protein